MNILNDPRPNSFKVFEHHIAPCDDRSCVIAFLAQISYLGF
jgi:hypothetical protein